MRKKVNILGVEIECLSYSLGFNEHKCYYESIEECYKNDDLTGLKTDDGTDIYDMRIYTHTPVGFTQILTNTLDELIAELKTLNEH